MVSSFKGSHSNRKVELNDLLFLPSLHSHATEETDTDANLDTIYLIAGALEAGGVDVFAVRSLIINALSSMAGADRNR